MLKFKTFKNPGVQSSINDHHSSKNSSFTNPVFLVVVSFQQDGLQPGPLVGLERLHGAPGLLELGVAHDHPGELQVLGQGLLQAGHRQLRQLGPLSKM